jgi:hypothetical protein
MWADRVKNVAEAKKKKKKVENNNDPNTNHFKTDFLTEGTQVMKLTDPTPYIFRSNSSLQRVLLNIF